MTESVPKQPAPQPRPRLPRRTFRPRHRSGSTRSGGAALGAGGQQRARAEAGGRARDAKPAPAGAASGRMAGRERSERRPRDAGPCAPCRDGCSAPWRSAGRGSAGLWRASARHQLANQPCGGTDAGAATEPGGRAASERRRKDPEDGPCDALKRGARPMPGREAGATAGPDRRSARPRRESPRPRRRCDPARVWRSSRPGSKPEDGIRPLKLDGLERAAGADSSTRLTTTAETGGRGRPPRPRRSRPFAGTRCAARPAA